MALPLTTDQSGRSVAPTERILARNSLISRLGSLFAFAPRRYVLALVVVVQAEGGAVLGVAPGLLAWVVTSVGYVAIENLSASVSNVPKQSVELALRVGVGLLLALGGGLFSEELSGERRVQLGKERCRGGRWQGDQDRVGGERRTLGHL